MSGSEKLPIFDQIHPDLRYLGQSPFGCLPTAAGASVPQVPHPFIAHIYPWSAGTDRQNRGLNRFSNSISQPASTAALVALAASRYVDKNISAHTLRNLSKQSFDNKLNIKENSTDDAPSQSEVPPKKKSKLQFDVDTLSGASLADPPDDVITPPRPVGLPYSGASTFPAAWQQLLFRCRSFDNFDGTSQNFVNFQPNFGNNRNLPVGNRRNRFFSESTKLSNSTSFERTESGELMPSISESQEIDVFSQQTNSISPNSDVIKSPWAVDGLNGKEKKLVEVNKKSIGIADTVKANCNDAGGISSNHIDSFRTSDTASDDSLISTNRRCSSASSDQSRDEPHQRPKRRRAGSLGDTCPVCGVTVRVCDMESHVVQELEKIERIPCEVWKKYGNTGQATSEKRAINSTAATSSMWASGKKSSDGIGKTDRSNRFKTYQKVRGNRLERLNTRVGRCLRSQEGSFPNNLTDGDSWPTSSSWSTHFNLPASCPVCCTRLAGSQSAMHDHISRCLRQRNVSQQLVEEEAVVDIEADTVSSNLNVAKAGCHGEGSGEWSSSLQAPSLMEAPSFPSESLVVKQRQLESESEKFLNVETDDTQTYGPVQYAEDDLVRVNNSKENEGNGAGESSITSDDPAAPSSRNASDEIVNSLQSKIAKLEDETRSTQCMICMGAYRAPVTSIQCWHVHCERCWLQALRVKKLCPQCNSITPLNKLRRIFL